MQTELIKCKDENINLLRDYIELMKNHNLLQEKYSALLDREKELILKCIDLTERDVRNLKIKSGELL